MASSSGNDNNNSNSNNKNNNHPETPEKPSSNSKQTSLKDLPPDQRIPGTVQIGAVSTYGDVMSGKGTWKLHHTMENPTAKELYDYVHAEMDKTGPTEPGPIHNGTRALVVRLPNNGYPEGTCAGCGAKGKKDGSALQQCGRCKGRKYCSRKCQKNDWSRHKSDCVQA